MPLQQAPKPAKVPPLTQKPAVVEPAPKVAVHAPLPRQMEEPPAPAPQPIEELAIPNVADGQLKVMGETSPEEAVLGISDMAIPRLILAQPTSVFEGADQNMGKWFNSVTGEFYENLNIVIVRVVIQRAVFPEPYDASLPILCASRDAITPYAEYVNKMIDGVTINGGCNECPLAEWTEADPITGKGKPPRCTLMYVYTGIEADSGMPFSMRLKGTAMTAARKLNFLYTQFKHSQVLQLGSVLGKGAKKYFVPTIGLAKQATPEYITEIANSILQSRSAAEPVAGSGSVPSAAEMPSEDDIPF